MSKSPFTLQEQTAQLRLAFPAESFSRQKVEYALTRYLEVAETPQHIVGHMEDEQGRPLSTKERNLLLRLLLWDIVQTTGLTFVLDAVSAPSSSSLPSRFSPEAGRGEEGPRPPPQAALPALPAEGEISSLPGSGAAPFGGQSSSGSVIRKKAV